MKPLCQLYREDIYALSNDALRELADENPEIYHSIEEPHSHLNQLDYEYIREQLDLRRLELQADLPDRNR